MGCYSSKQIDYVTRDDGSTERKPVTNAASPETNVSTTRSDHSPQLATPGLVFGSDSLPTGPDVTQFAASAQATGLPADRSTHKARSRTYVDGFNPPETPGQVEIPPLPSALSRRESVSTQPDEAPKSHRHPSAPTDPDKKSPLKFDELQGLPSASGKTSGRVNSCSRTGQLTERTETKFKGDFSEVSQAKFGGRMVAAKTLRVANTERDESRIRRILTREIGVWARLDHPNVLELLTFVMEDGQPCLISPWCDNGTLQEYLQKFPDADRRRLVRDLAEGLRYLHEQMPPIIHGDLHTAS